MCGVSTGNDRIGCVRLGGTEIRVFIAALDVRYRFSTTGSIFEQDSGTSVGDVIVHLVTQIR